MVTTRSCRTSSSAATDHSPLAPCTSELMLLLPQLSRRLQAHHGRPPPCAFAPVLRLVRPLIHRSPTSFLRHRLLPLVRGLPLSNFQIVREFYANFPDVSAASIALSGLVVRVRGVAIPLSFHFISAALDLPPIRSGSSCVPVLDFLPRRQLVNCLYVSPPEVLPTKLSSGMMSQWTRTLYMLVRNYLNPTSQHGKFYVRESLIVAGAANATVPTSSLVLPRIITALAAHARVPALPTDDIGSSDSIKVNNQVTLHRSDAHCTSGGFSIEQQALLDLLSASHQVTHALLRCIWNRLDTYSELLLSVAGHIQPVDPPSPPQARSI
ncbi:unnamed protein product [Prunus armeniaca]